LVNVAAAFGITHGSVSYSRDRVEDLRSAYDQFRAVTDALHEEFTNDE
jgi:hypothetical protein